MDAVVWDIIDDIGVLHDSDIISKWLAKHGADDITEAIQAVHTQQKEGLFLSHRPKRMLGYEDPDSLLSTYRAGPEQIILEVTAQCNLRCLYCIFSGQYYYERTHFSCSMSKTVMRQSLAYARSCALAIDGEQERGVSFYGGEPLLRYEVIRELISEFNCDRDVRWIFRIVTNETLINEEMAKFFAENGVFLQVSLDGPRHIHDRYRVFPNGSPTFDRILKNLAMLRKLAPTYYDTHVVFAVTIGPGSDLHAIDDFFKSEPLVENHPLTITFLSSYDTNLFTRIGNYTPAQVKQREQLKLDYISRLARNETPTQVQSAFFAKSLRRIHRRTAVRLGEFIPANGTCYPGITRVFVNVNGELTPCEKVGSAACFRLGKVETGIDIKAAKGLIDRYVEVSEKECIKCWAQRLCDLCFNSGRKGDSLSLHRKREECARALTRFHEELVMYASIMEKNPRAFDDLIPYPKQ
ncbi:MAG: radical SAM protein [candidate division WOR-3 bacterium]